MIVKPGIAVTPPNPKTLFGASLEHSAWAYALKQPGGNDASAKDFVQKIFANVPVLDSGARGSTTTFVERGIGRHVLLAWENEAYLAAKELARKKSISLCLRYRFWLSRRSPWWTKTLISTAREWWPRPT